MTNALLFSFHFDLIIWTFFAEMLEIWSSWSLSFLNSLVTSYRFDPNIFLGILFSTNLSLCFSYSCKTAEL
jgi:hypothetical protein